MNFLAHAALSYDDPYISLGNTTADLLRNNEVPLLPMPVQKGVQLHRHIDTFTDENELTRTAIGLIRDTQGKYAPVVTDLFWDLFLAKHWDSFIDIPLDQLISKTYTLLRNEMNVFPDRVQKKIHFLLERDFLTMYTNVKDMQIIMERIQERARFDAGFLVAMQEFEDHNPALEALFLRFFPSLQKEVRNWLSKTKEH